jgi:two-component system chemotaxis response regulator CheY
LTFKGAASSPPETQAALGFIINVKESPLKALVIDDSRAMRTIIGQILKSIGYEVMDAGNGREGLQRINELGPPHLILVDWNMPEMNGIDFVRALRSDRKYDDVRVMMVTTETEMKRMAEALEHGANEYVMKPFTRDVILQKLEQMQSASV